MFERLQLRHENCTDRARVNGAIAVSTRALVDRTGTQAGGTANAMQRLPSLFILQDACAPVVQQDNVKLLWPVAGIHRGPHGDVRAHTFAGGRSRQHVEENFKVLKRRDDFLNSYQADQHVRQGEAHAAVAFALDHHQRASLSHSKIGSAYSNLYSQKFLAEITSRSLRQLRRLLSQIGKTHLLQRHLALEDLPDLQMVDMQGRNYEMRGK